MAARSLTDLKQRIIDSGLLSADELQTVVSACETDSAEDLARELVRQQKLTDFQSTVLLEGRNQPLILGDYVIIDWLGAGGMGKVYKARHRWLDQVVALKVLPPDSAASQELVKRFRREGEAIAQLEHRNIVQYLDAGEDKGVHFLVTRFIDGSDLSSLIRRKEPLPVKMAVGCILHAARGLEYAHKQGLVHRDIKPSNLLLGRDGILRISDMGLARLDGHDPFAETVTELTHTGAVMGTVDYMAPEQAEDSRRADARSDIYSLGCTLYFLLTGRPVYAGETVIKKVLAHREAPIPSLKAHASDVPASLDRLFRRMVAKRPSDRPLTATDLVRELEDVLPKIESPTTKANDVPPKPPLSGQLGLSPQLKRDLHWIALILTGIVAVLLLMATFPPIGSLTLYVGLVGLAALFQSAVRLSSSTRNKSRIFLIKIGLYVLTLLCVVRFLTSILDLPMMISVTLIVGVLVVGFFLTIRE